jgi:serine/threonine protein kinase
VLLRDEPDASPPVVGPGSGEEALLRRAGRYHVLGEIARGGMGIVLKGRDPDLGRDVAMKVLHPSHARSPAMIQRFIEEAQIGGQLQHPGILPVYELGLDTELRPYFTMRLVHGRTLTALLEERPDPTKDLGRFLAIFEQVCQTVAYAHARGVIHRDLKPSNVMVGAFGEVLVVDWGLAKILRQGGEGEGTRPNGAIPTSRP